MKNPWQLSILIEIFNMGNRMVHYYFGIEEDIVLIKLKSKIQGVYAYANCPVRALYQ